MLKKIFIFAILGFIALILGIVFALQQPIVMTENENQIVVEIKKGQTLSELAYSWQVQGWLPSAKVLLIHARVSGSAKNIKPGEFEIPENTRAYEVLTLLTQGSSKRYKVSFIEGTRLTDVLTRLQQAPKLIQDIQPLTTSNVQAALGLSALAEGWVYPDTYVYHSGDTVSSIITQAHLRMQNILNEEWQRYTEKLSKNEIKELPYRSAYEALVMASIVEKETGQASERPEIAGVFIRRLQMNMRLETDPTVIYGLGENYQGNLQKKHLRDRSNPYNTYRNKGLPPTPIALAGRAAINAALNPDNGDSLYFVAKGDGSHYFSTSLEEHNRAVRKYQIFRRSKDYRSAPVAN
ncbi:Aminodeoxychorismate lyase family protein [Oleispira antarctica RB-8]|uniref:Endolytic murein transglycosylase n=1 Tax=Oleispira antarctica RB-8 TaxID=698738 RepID=R4YTX4_OLEAN|nr:Aminodeoxychorismate lyase family protein [Oleispira antarctica RB-8]